jgi:hypothetical protein
MSDDKLPTLFAEFETDLALFDCNSAIISDIFVLCHWIFFDVSPFSGRLDDSMQSTLYVMPLVMVRRALF